MSNFAEVLERSRRERGFSQAELARRISKSPQYISALERQRGATFPSVNTLRKLVTKLAQDEDEGVTNLQVASDLALSGIGLDLRFKLPVNIMKELADQGKAPVGSEFWILSDVLVEAESKDFAEITAENIVKRRMRYTYFVPFSGERYHWQRARKWLQELVVDLELLKKHTSIYQISDCAFTSRLRITNPRGDEPTARYGLGARERMHLNFYPAPQELVVRTVSVLNTLLLLEEEQRRAAQEKGEPTDWIFGDCRLGFIRRVFPELPKL